MNFDHLPVEVVSEITRRGIAEGMLPKPDGYDSDGRPSWLLSTMAAWFGHSEQGAKQIIERIACERSIRPFLDPATIHRIQ